MHERGRLGLREKYLKVVFSCLSQMMVIVMMMTLSSRSKHVMSYFLHMLHFEEALQKKYPNRADHQRMSAVKSLFFHGICL